MTTHNIEIGFSLSSRIAIISNGAISYIQESSSKTVDEFKSDYKYFTGVTN